MYSVIDIESNGAGFREESITEVAIYKFDGHKIIDQFSSIINPEADITHFVQKLTGITPKIVKTAPKFHEVAKRIIEITKDSTLVGHNVDFDYRLLKQSFKKLGYDFSIDTLDTISLAKELLPNEESYSLGKLSKSLGIPLTKHHRASEDARATLDLLKILLKKDKNKTIIQAYKKKLTTQIYTHKIKDLTENLPCKRGIIYFQNVEGKIIFSTYVDNFYEFAQLVLNSKLKKWKTIQKKCTQIYYEPTISDLFSILILKTKKLRIEKKYTWGLFFEKENFQIKKIDATTEKPILFFKNHLQTQSIFNQIIHHEQFKEYQKFRDFINLKNKNFLLTGKGNNRGEKSFVLIEKGRISSYGFYELFHQIKTYENLSKIKISVGKNSPELTNELKLSLIKGEFTIQKIPE